MKFEEERTELEQKFFEICETVAKAQGQSLYDMEYTSANTTLRMFIYDENSKSAHIDDCVKVDRAMTDHLQEEWIPEGFVLEVSSPGVYRNLSRYDHFQLALGEKIACVLNKKLDRVEHVDLPKKLNGQRKMRGVLKDINKEGLLVDIDKYNLKLNFLDIKKANIDPDFSDIGRKSEMG